MNEHDAASETLASSSSGCQITSLSWLGNTLVFPLIKLEEVAGGGRSELICLGQNKQNANKINTKGY